jgi:hypothetical protein
MIERGDVSQPQDLDEAVRGTLIGLAAGDRNGGPTERVGQMPTR